MPALIQPALGSQQKPEAGGVDSPRTASWMQPEATHLLVVTQSYDQCTRLFRVPVGQNDSTQRRLCANELQLSIRPDVLVRPFMKHVVGTAEIVKVRLEIRKAWSLAEQRCRFQAHASPYPQCRIEK